MRAIITGTKNNQPSQVTVDFVHENTAIAAGQGVGLIAETLLDQRIIQVGLYPVEQIMTSDLFLELAEKRNLKIIMKS